MVNNDSAYLRLMAFEPAPNPLPHDRKLVGPRYDLLLVQQSVGSSDRIKLITQDCISDLQNLGWTNENVLELLHATTVNNYRDSQWCATGRGYSVDCDSYVLNFDAASGTQNSNAPEIYFKFGFRPNFTFLLVISCHDS
jgi:hypothetical protein